MSQEPKEDKRGNTYGWTHPESLAIRMLPLHAPLTLPEVSAFAQTGEDHVYEALRSGALRGTISGTRRGWRVLVKWVVSWVEDGMPHQPGGRASAGEVKPGGEERAELLDGSTRELLSALAAPEPLPLAPPPRAVIRRGGPRPSKSSAGEAGVDKGAGEPLPRL